MSFMRNYGFFISVTDPLWFTKRLEYEIDLSAVTGWEHEISFDFGYRDARMSFSIGEIGAQEWLANGLGRHVTFFDAAQNVRWEGFVNVIKAGLGPLVLERGPILEVVNRCSVVYTPIVDATVDPIVTGAEIETVISEDYDSQIRYAIQEEIVSGGTLMDDATYTGGSVTNEAEAIRNAYLEEFKYPQLSQEINIGTGSVSYIQLELRGYRDFLSRYIYNNNIVSPATTVIPDKLKAILAADPNGIFSTNYEHIQETAEFLQLTPAWENESRTAETIADEMVALGTGTDRRTYLAVYNNRLCYYDQIPSKIEYEYRINEGQPVITDLYGDAPIQPWEVTPGKWTIFPDVSPGQTVKVSNVREDPRIMFVESVKYTAPYTVELSGGKVSNWRKFLEKYGVL